jgi:hypothetical protein
MTFEPTRRAALALPAALATPIAARPGLDTRWRDLARVLGSIHPNGGRTVAQAAALGVDIGALNVIVLGEPLSAAGPQLFFRTEETPGFLQVGPSGRER